jgi:bifunctional non-homologous end joining protein LigD
MLAAAAKAPFSGAGWIFELKYDGFRSLTIKHGNRVRTLSRTGRDMAAEFPELVAEARARAHDFIIDGELVICDEHGCPQFDRLNGRARLRRPDRVRSAAAADPAAIFAFDLLEYDRQDYRNYPLSIRKAQLAGVLRGSKRILRAGAHRDVAGRALGAGASLSPGRRRREAGELALPRRAQRGLAEDQDARRC